MPERSSGAILAGDAYVGFGGDLTPLQSAMGSAGQMLTSWALRMGAVVAGAFAFQKLAQGMSSGIRAALDTEDANLRLASAIRGVDDNWESASQSAIDYAEALDRQIAGDKNAVKSAMAVAAAVGHFSGDSLKDAAKAALSWGHIMRMGPEQAMEAIVASIAGGRNVFKKFGIELDETMTKQEKLAKLLQAGEPAWQMIQASMNSTSGRAIVMSKAWGVVGEAFGNAFRDGARLSALLDNMTESADGTSSSIASLGEGLGVLVRVLATGFDFIFTVVKTALLGIQSAVAGVLWVLTDALVALLNIVGKIPGAVGRGAKEAAAAVEGVRETLAEKMSVTDDIADSWSDMWKRVERTAFAAPAPKLQAGPGGLPGEQIEGAGGPGAPTTLGTILGSAFGAMPATPGPGAVGISGVAPGVGSVASAPSVSERPATANLQETANMILENIFMRLSRPQPAVMQ